MKVGWGSLTHRHRHKQTYLSWWVVEEIDQLCVTGWHEAQICSSAFCFMFSSNCSRQCVGPYHMSTFLWHNYSHVPGNHSNCRKKMTFLYKWPNGLLIIITNWLLLHSREFIVFLRTWPECLSLCFFHAIKMWVVYLSVHAEWLHENLWCL